MFKSRDGWVGDRLTKHVELRLCVWQYCAPELHCKFILRTAEDRHRVIFEELSRFLRSVPAMVVGRYKLVLHFVVCDCLFEVGRSFVVEDVYRRRLVPVT